MFSSSAAIYPPRQPRHRHQRRLLLDSMILLRLLLLQPSTFPAGFPTKPRSDPPHIPVPALRSRDGAAAAGSCLALASVTWQGAPPHPQNIWDRQAGLCSHHCIRIVGWDFLQESGKLVLSGKREPAERSQVKFPLESRSDNLSFLPRLLLGTLMETLKSLYK